MLAGLLAVVDRTVAIAVMASSLLIVALVKTPELNVPVCALLLRRFSTLFPIFNVGTGVVMLWLSTADEVRHVWLCLQLCFVAHLFTDATSATSPVRSGAWVDFGLFAAANVCMCFSMFYGFIPHDATRRVNPLGLFPGVNAFQTTIGAQFTTTVYSVKFSRRAWASCREHMPVILQLSTAELELSWS